MKSNIFAKTKLIVCYFIHSFWGRVPLFCSLSSSFLQLCKTIWRLHSALTTQYLLCPFSLCYLGISTPVKFYLHISIMTLPFSVGGFIVFPSFSKHIFAIETPMIRFWTDIEVAVLLIPGHKQSVNCTCRSISWLDSDFFLNPGSQGAFKLSRGVGSHIDYSSIFIVNAGGDWRTQLCGDQVF